MKDERVIEIPIDLIKNFKNSRLRIESVDLVPLMEDIKHRGLLQPIGVAQEGEEYIIRFGNRRLEACKKLGWKTIPAIISDREINEDSFMADNIAENYHRVENSPVDLALQYKSYFNRGYSPSEISSLLNIPLNQIKSALKTEEKAPETFKKLIKYMRGKNRNKKGKIPQSVASEIFNYSDYLTDKEKKRLLENARQNELTGLQIRLIKNLIKNGLHFNEALKEYKKWKIIGTEIPMKIEELKKYEINNISLIKGFISGEIKPNKKLLP